MIVDIVPTNFFNAASDNRNMLQIVFVAILFGIGLIQLPPDKSKPLIDVFDALSHAVIRLVDLIMKMAPLGVFALIAGTITSVTGDDPSQVLQLLGALGFYMLTVILGMLLHVGLTYGTLLKLWTPLTFRNFYSGIAPAQQVLAPYAHPVIFLFLGSFLLAESFRKYGLDRRVARHLLGLRAFSSSPRGLLAGLGVV